jgi:hypothetical protein
MEDDMELELMTDAFEEGGAIPRRYTCEGANVSPPLSWRGVPEGTKSLVLVCEDPDAPNGTWSHWVLYNLPPDAESLDEGYSAGPNVEEGRNDFGNTGYGGPCPPRGSTHRYFFRLYALDRELEATAGATRQQILDRIQDHTLGQAALMGRYARG